MAGTSRREQIVREADRLFYRGGFRGTSFADIAGAVGISRGNFYYHFRTKDEILDAVILHRIARTRTMLATWEREGVSPLERIGCFIRILVANRNDIMDFGCPVGSLSSELVRIDHVSKRQAADIFIMFRDWLAEQFCAMGHGRDKAMRLAFHLLGRSQGIAVMANVFGDEEFIRSEVAELEEWVKTLDVGS